MLQKLRCVSQTKPGLRWREPVLVRGFWDNDLSAIAERVEQDVGVILRPRRNENIVSGLRNPWSKNPVAMRQVLRRQRFGQGRLDLYEDLNRENVNFEKSAIFVTSSHLRTPLHSDPEDSILAHVAGVKRILVVHPGDSDPCPDRLQQLLKLRYRSGTHDDLLPDLADLRCFHVDLTPGDALFLPRRWLHDVESRTATISLALRFFP